LNGGSAGLAAGRLALPDFMPASATEADGVAGVLPLHASAPKQARTIVQRRKLNRAMHNTSRCDPFREFSLRLDVPASEGLMKILWTCLGAIIR
jgi:hypothetical protein